MTEAPLFDFELVTPSRRVLAIQPEMVVIPGSEGDFGVLRDHSPLMSALRPGIVAVHARFDDPPDSYFVTGGFAEVRGTSCRVLADTVTPVEHLSRTDAEDAVRTAEAALRDADTPRAREKVEQDLEVARAMRDAAG